MVSQGAVPRQYFDLNARHFPEKHDRHFRYTWVNAALQGAGLVGQGAYARSAPEAASAAAFAETCCCTSTVAVIACLIRKIVALICITLQSLCDSFSIVQS